MSPYGANVGVNRESEDLEFWESIGLHDYQYCGSFKGLIGIMQVLGFSGRMEKQMENKMESEIDTRLV